MIIDSKANAYQIIKTVNFACYQLYAQIYTIIYLIIQFVPIFFVWNNGTKCKRTIPIQQKLETSSYVTEVREISRCITYLVL